jgi:hypothetical protein
MVEVPDRHQHADFIFIAYHASTPIPKYQKLFPRYLTFDRENQASKAIPPMNVTVARTFSISVAIENIPAVVV